LIGGGFGALLLILSGLSIWLTINSALKPLNEVERTAEAVTEGDISQRLIEHEGDTEIARLNRSLNTMLDGIQGAMQDRSKTLDQMRRFVSDASHELRTPLVSVRGYAELYRMGALKKPEQIAEAMGRIESEAVRMTGLVESLLTLTRMDESTKLDLKKTNLVSLATDAAKDASVADGKRKIVVTDINGNQLADGASVEAKVDANSMRQVLTNLLANASRFSPEGAQIEIALDNNAKIEGRRHLVLEVRDHGEGIPEQLREKIFERFYRIDNSRNSETGGSGLGLAIVSTIVSRHGGNIVATETPGGGATLRVVIPA
jgi:two-component system OmpR family sensor kinase